jgi:hypothetical protein
LSSKLRSTVLPGSETGLTDGDVEVIPLTILRVLR